MLEHEIKSLKPPSNRTQAIYCRVMIEGCPVEQVAKEYAVGVERIKKVVCEVKRWIRRTPGGVPLDATRETGLALRQLHLARLEHQWEQLMLAWYRSTQAEETEKVVGDEKGQRKAEKTRRTQTGDVKYLEQARQIMAEMRALSTSGIGNQQSTEESTHVESLTLAQREAALDCLLETLGERARAEETSRTPTRQNAAA
jgi:hypothetical protein